MTSKKKNKKNRTIYFYRSNNGFCFFLFCFVVVVLFWCGGSHPVYVLPENNQPLLQRLARRFSVHIYIYIYIYIYIWQKKTWEYWTLNARDSDYYHRIWNQWSAFKCWIRLFVVHIALIFLEMHKSIFSSSMVKQLETTDSLALIWQSI